MPLIAVVLMAASYAVFLLPRDTVYALGREDGLFEDLSAVCFFCASAVFAIVFWRSGRAGAAVDADGVPRRRNVWFALLAILFFFGGGEEISWGQRIFGWETPDAFQEANVQRETNIHNLVIFNRNDANWQGKTGAAEFLSAERMFSLFWLGFCLATPLAHALVPPLRRLLERVRMPIVPLLLGVLFLVNYSMGEFLKPHALRVRLDWPLMEIKECLFSVLFLLIAVYFAVRQRAARPVAAPAPVAPAAAAPVRAGATPVADDEALVHAAL